MNIITKCMKQKYNEEYLDDHMYLIFYNIIIDPTYRQFFNSYENYKFTMQLYEDNSFCL